MTTYTAAFTGSFESERHEFSDPTSAIRAAMGMGPGSWTQDDTGRVIYGMGSVDSFDRTWQEEEAITLAFRFRYNAMERPAIRDLPGWQRSTYRTSTSERIETPEGAPA
jgi:hypothetical protein